VLPVTPRPHVWSGVCVCSVLAARLISFQFLAFSGSPESRTRHNAVISRVWTTGPRLPLLVGHLGVEPRPSCSQSRRAPICTSARWSVRTAGFEPGAPPRSGGPPGPRPGAITRLHHVLIVSNPDHPAGGARSRTQPARPERPMTSPEVERAVLRAYRQRKWTRGRSNPRLPGFNQALNRLSYRSGSVVTHLRKKPDVASDTGLWWSPRVVAKCHKRGGCPGSALAG
jgi:hypothetical protein